MCIPVHTTLKTEQSYIFEDCSKSNPLTHDILIIFNINQNNV